MTPRNCRTCHSGGDGGRGMKIAVVGTGIAGNVVAHRLAPEHDITVYESAGRIGGHTNTIDVELGGRHWAVDTGFIVYNDVTYPNFIALLDELGVVAVLGKPFSPSLLVRTVRQFCENATVRA